METKFLFFNSRDELLRMDIVNIIYFEADGNYTKIVMANGLSGVVTMNLSQTQKILSAQLMQSAQNFARVGKRYIINMQYVYQINIIKQRLVLSDCKHFSFQIEISKEALRKLKDIFVTSSTALK